MKLSTAIRIGSMTTKQIPGYLTDHRNGRCALGAAYDAAGILNDSLKSGLIVSKIAEKTFPVLKHHVTASVDGVPYTGILGNIIWFLNDRDNWTRDQIADWVEKIENKVEQKQKENKLEVSVK